MSTYIRVIFLKKILAKKTMSYTLFLQVKFRTVWKPKMINKFIDNMASNGIYPSSHSDIKADNIRRDFHLVGDPHSKRKGYYKLLIDGDFGVGFYGDWRTGECHSWHSKIPNTYTKEEKRAFAERLRAQRERDEAERIQMQAQAALEASEFMLFVSDCVSHPYIEKKGVVPYGLSISGQDLIIPMCDENDKIWNYQRISPDGDKLFLKGARKQGTWHEIRGDETICICEGLATGLSIHEATGHTVIVAFDAGNLVSVAPKIKQKYPVNDIIFCADNDHERINKRTGEKQNIGVLKAIEAAKSILCERIVYPEFSSLDVGLSDFNDLHKAYGLDAVRNTIFGLAPEEAAGGGVTPTHGVDLQPVPCGDLVADNAWREQLIYKKKREDGIEPRSVVNLLLFMENHEFLKGVFKYDGFAKRIIIHRCPPWEDESGFSVRPVCDYDYVRLEAFLEAHFGIKTSKEKCADAIFSTAQIPENSFNPAADYFNSLVWDGIDRINSWLCDYVSDGAQPQEYLSLVGKKFLCGLAARAMYAGCKFDTMLILEGKQYAGKSYLSKVLGTINDVEYFLDDFKDIENKDALMKIQGKLVVEFPEISTMRKAEVNDLKAFLSRTHDVFRPPYGRNTVEAGRQCVFIGTVNPEGGYLRDVTGNRRYWPVSCRDKIGIDDLKDIMPQLHAQAAHMVKNGERLFLERDEYEICVKEQDKRVLADVWSDKIADIVEPYNTITTNDILLGLNISMDKATPQVQSRINQTMIYLGYTPERLSIGGKRKRGYVKKQAQKEFKYEKEEEIAW